MRTAARRRHARHVRLQGEEDHHGFPEPLGRRRYILLRRGVPTRRLDPRSKSSLTPSPHLAPPTPLQDFAVDVHTNGWTKTITDKHIRDSVQKTMYCTFSDRFEAMRKLLSGSKRTCEGILKGEKMANVVGNPWELDTRTTSNKNSNEVKGDKLQRATKRDREEMEKSEAREKEAARPVKKARARKD